MLCFHGRGYVCNGEKQVCCYFYSLQLIRSTLYIFLYSGVESRYASGDNKIYYHLGPYGGNNIKLDSAQVHRLFQGSSGGDVMTFVRK